MVACVAALPAAAEPPVAACVAALPAAAEPEPTPFAAASTVFMVCTARASPRTARRWYAGLSTSVVTGAEGVSEKVVTPPFAMSVFRLGLGFAGSWYSGVLATCTPTSFFGSGTPPTAYLPRTLSPMVFGFLPAVDSIKSATVSTPNVCTVLAGKTASPFDNRAGMLSEVAVPGPSTYGVPFANLISDA